MLYSSRTKALMKLFPDKIKDNEKYVCYTVKGHFTVLWIMPQETYKNWPWSYGRDLESQLLTFEQYHQFKPSFEKFWLAIQEQHPDAVRSDWEIIHRLRK